jgi:uncharacterized membrane protein required for colicin V production
MISSETLNLILALTVALFVINGTMQGLIHMVGSIIGLIVGVAVASRLDEMVGAWLAGVTGWSKPVTVIIAFIVILLVFTRVFGLLVTMIEKAFKILRVPLVGLLNRIGGAALGLVEGTLVVGATLILLQGLPVGGLSGSIAGSSMAAALITAAKVIVPLLPKTVREIYQVKP